MQIKRIDTNFSKRTFNGALNNKALLNGLEFVADHSASFVVGTSALMAMTVKPLSIALAPKTEKKNKQYLTTEAISSGLIKFLMAEMIALPIEKSIKAIDKNPTKFLNEKTIQNLKEPAKNLVNSKDYKILTQLIKQLANFVSAIPKSMITIALIPVLMDLLFKEKKPKKASSECNMKIEKRNEVFDDFSNNDNSNPSFKGITNGIAKVINNSTVQNIVKKANLNEANVARNVSIATDLLLTSSFVFNTKKSKKIEKERKNPLILNHLISTGAFFLMGCSADNLIQKYSKNLVEKFKTQNINNPKLHKYLEGINVARSTLTFALVYYALLPVASTFLSEKIDKMIPKKNNNSIDNSNKK